MGAGLLRNFIERRTQLESDMSDEVFLITDHYGITRAQGLVREPLSTQTPIGSYNLLSNATSAPT